MPDTSNRLTGDLRAMIQVALSDAGGQAYLAKQARENPVAFLALVGKCLPRDVKVGAQTSLVDLLVASHELRQERASSRDAVSHRRPVNKASATRAKDDSTIDGEESIPDQ